MPSTTTPDLRTLWLALRRALKKRGIASAKLHHSNMIRGLATVSQEGVNVRLGEEWERPGFITAQLARARRMGRKGAAEEYRNVKPTCIVVDVEVRYPYGDAAKASAREREAKLWAEVDAAAAEVGLVPQGGLAGRYVPAP